MPRRWPRIPRKRSWSRATRAAGRGRGGELSPGRLERFDRRISGQPPRPPCTPRAHRDADAARTQEREPRAEADGREERDHERVFPREVELHRQLAVAAQRPQRERHCEAADAAPARCDARSTAPHAARARRGRAPGRRTLRSPADSRWITRATLHARRARGASPRRAAPRARRASRAAAHGACWSSSHSGAAPAPPRPPCGPRRGARAPAARGP